MGIFKEPLHPFQKATSWLPLPALPPRQRPRVHADPPGAVFVVGWRGGSAISPDGRTIAFITTSGGLTSLWVRPLNSAPRELTGTEGAHLPFWSPDSRSIGFFAGGKLKRVEIAGGPPVAIAEVSNARGGSWNAQGTIIFGAESTSIRRVSAAGGMPVSVTDFDPGTEGVGHRWPQFLPDGRRFIYHVLGGTRGAGINLGSLDQPHFKTRLVDSASNGVIIPPRGRLPGRLLRVREDALTAQPFDPDRAQLSGDPVTVPGAEAVSTLTGPGLARFSASNDGTVLFMGGVDNFQLTWYSRQGKVWAPSAGPPAT